MTFTCTANDCGHRSTHEFSRRSYQKGIVLVQCPSCKNRSIPLILISYLTDKYNRHLIADHLGWFDVRLPGFALLDADGRRMQQGMASIELWRIYCERGENRYERVKSVRRGISSGMELHEGCESEARNRNGPYSSIPMALMFLIEQF